MSREEAIQLIEDDRRIDRGEKLFELDPELEAGAKKARQAPRAKAYEFKPRERKAKPEKAELCEAMRQGLVVLGIEDFEVTQPEREFLFMYNGKKYKVTLACPRN